MGRGITKRVPFIRATADDIAEQVKSVDNAPDLKTMLDAKYTLFRMIWRLPVNEGMRHLVKTYMWPNIREWKKDATPDRPDEMRAYAITLNNCLSKLRTGLEDG